MTKTKLDTKDLIIKYRETKDEDYLKKLFDRNINFIRYKLNSYYLYQYQDLAIAYAYENIWKSINNYNSDKKDADDFIAMVIDRALKSLLKDLNRGYNNFNREALSINKKINETTEESKEYSYYALIDEEANPESIYLERIETQEKINKLINQLTKLEHKVFIAYIKTFKPTPQGKANIDEMISLTNIHKKSIDNALQRIKLKASKIS